MILIITEVETRELLSGSVFAVELPVDSPVTEVEMQELGAPTTEITFVGLQGPPGPVRPASGVSVTPSSGISSTNVQDALEELSAEIANGSPGGGGNVTGGDNHDHSGGDGAQIAYGSLSGTPDLGNASSLDVGTGPNTVAAGDDPRIVKAVDLATVAGIVLAFG